MDTKELLMYEMPAIGEFVPWPWLQEIIAYFLARKITRKLERYNTRKNRAQLIASLKESPLDH